MKRQITMVLCTVVSALTLLAVPQQTYALEQGGELTAPAENQMRDYRIVERGGALSLRLEFAHPLAAQPGHFSVATPARIAFDFPNTINALGRVQETVNRGDLRSLNIVEANGRTRLVLNLDRLPAYESRIEGSAFVIALSPAARPQAGGSPATQANQALANYSAQPVADHAHSIRDMIFRRGEEGEGRVIVQLSHPDTVINVHQQGSGLVVDFTGASLPAHLQRRYDVIDFGTPISHMEAQPQGVNSRLKVSPNGLWEHSAYQTDAQFVLEVRRVEEDPNKLVQRGGRETYGGEKLSLNFQDVDIRSVLQVIADFTDFNIVTSDSVTGNLTLRLNDVPWDQALDIILQAKGLDKRRTGNVIWIAPSGEVAARERQQLETLSQRGDLEPLITESFQVNYHSAKDIHGFLKNKDQTVLSKRGSVVVDERSNKVFVTDVGHRLDAVRHLVQEIDVAPRQVLIEARIVEANKNFARDVGVRLGYGDTKARHIGNGGRFGLGTFNPDGSISGGEEAVSGDGFQPTGFGVLNMTLFNSSLTRFLNLELNALESDGRGRIVSSPRVMTANQMEATIEEGDEVPYQEATSSGATNVSFKKAVLSLKVRPQITPDGRVQLKVAVNKDRPDFSREVAGVPPILTKNVETEVLVDNGGTVVIGGIYEESEVTNVNRVPLLGEIPFLGALFRATTRETGKRELLVFITPRIVADSLTLR